MKFKMLIAAAIAAIASISVPMASAVDPTVPIRVEQQADANGIVTMELVAPEGLDIQAGGCGQVAYQGTVKKTNIYSVTLWTYRAYIKVSYCNYKVTAVNYFYAEPIDTCCGWDWKGQVSKQVSPTLPYTYVQGYIKGHFRACIPVPLLPDVCDDDWPWMVAKINGNGALTNFQWGY